MRNKKCLRFITTALMLTILTGSAVGCTNKKTVEIEDMKPVESPAISFDVIGGKDVMPLFGYHGPSVLDWSQDGIALPEMINEETYKMIADCGINLISYSFTDQNNAPEIVEQMMDLAYENGVGSFVFDSAISNAYGENSISVDKMAEHISEYVNHPGFAGMYLIDEPGTHKYNIANGHYVSDYPELYDKLVRQIGVPVYFNLLPITEMDKKEDYIAYVEEYLTTVKPTYLCYDKYPFEEANQGKEDVYFWNLGLMRDYAQQYNIPLWTFMQCGDQWYLTKDTEKYWPTQGQYYWQVNTNLAFGVQGIQYHTLLEYIHSAWAETEMFDSYRSGLIGLLGNKNQWWYYTQEINKHVAAIDHVLMNSVNVGVIASGEKATWATRLCSDKTMMEGTSWRELKNVEGEALVGCFNYQGKTALYVANYSTEYAQKIKLSFVDKYNVTVFQQAKANHYNADSLTLDMPAGDGVLIVFNDK